MRKKEVDFEKRLQELDRLEEQLKLKKQVEERERELGLRWTFKKPTWAKTMMVAMVLICLEIIVYSEIVMWAYWDLSALYALIGVPASMFGIFWAYCEKSKAENTKGGIVYDMAMQAEPEPEPSEGMTGSEEAAG